MLWLWLRNMVTKYGSKKINNINIKLLKRKNIYTIYGIYFKEKQKQ